MAFGDKIREKVNFSSGESEGQIFESPFVDSHNGTRIFRFLPATDEHGQSLNSMPDEIVWRECWWKALRDGTEISVKVILDWKNPFGDPLWNYVAKNFEKGSRERKNFKTKFAFNVFDKTPVLLTDEGQIIYPDEKGRYVRVASTSNKVLGQPLKGDAKPLNKVRILMGSFGSPGGRHDFQNLLDATEDIEGPDGESKQPFELDFKWKITGEDLETRRGFHMTSNFSKLDPAIIALPRYDLESWTKPWPHGAINDLLDDKDLNEIIEEYGIILYPQLKSFNTEETLDYADTETDKPKGKRKAAKFEEQ